MKILTKDELTNNYNGCAFVYWQADYSMLEDVKRIADSAKRMRMQICGKYYSGLSFPLKHLLKAAKNRRIRLFFLPTGMSKREANKTYYNNM